jgi:competence ComEA-like helix-hairpin-helix protein
MKREIKDFLSFNRIERTGLCILLALVLLLVFANAFYDDFVSYKSSDFTKFEQEVNDFILARKELRDSQYSKNTGFTNESNSFNPFVFNPNNLPENEWKLLGLNDRQIKVIKNFEAKGGRFYSKTDLQKMYCISANDYERLEPWIKIPETENQKYSTTTSFSKPRAIIELNSADTNDLMQLSGIGPYMAANILKYRTKLGGFSQIEQLKDVYRMSPETYEKIIPQLSVDTSLIIPGVKINSADFYSLLRHPYIDKPLAYSITAHRQRYGKYKTISDFRKVEGVNDSLWTLLRPYLNTED